MTTLTITTVKGAKIDLAMHDSGAVEASVNGKLHTYAGAVGYSDEHITLAGKVRAQVQPHDVASVEAFFTAASARGEAWRAEQAAQFTASSEGFSARMDARMYGRNSSH